MALPGLLVATVAIIFVVSASVAVSGAGNFTRPTEVHLGGLFPLTGGLSSGGVEREACFRLGVEQINARDDILYNITLVAHIADTETDPGAAVKAAHELITTDRVVGIVGAASSGVSTAVQYLARAFQIPQVSYSSTAAELSDKARFAYFLRVVAPDSVQGAALAHIAASFNWREVGIVASNDVYGQSTAHAFEDTAEALGIGVLATRYFASGTTELELTLSPLLELNVRIILLNCILADAENVLVAAQAMGLTGPGYVWIGTDGWAQDAMFSTVDPDLLKGVIATRPLNRGGQLYEELLDVWEGLDPAVYPGAGDRDINLYAPYAYDALFSYAHAIDALLEAEVELTGVNLLARLYITSFNGVTGPISFDARGDRLGVYELVNAKNGAQFEPVGQWDIETSLTLTSPVIWADGSTDVPLDHNCLYNCSGSGVCRDRVCDCDLHSIGTWCEIDTRRGCDTPGYVRYASGSCAPCAIGTYANDTTPGAVCRQCPNPSACLGANLCADGYAGEYCGLCAGHYARVGSQCVACTAFQMVPAMLLMVIGVLGLVYVMALPSPLYDTYRISRLKIGIHTVQLTSLLVRVSGVTDSTFLQALGAVEPLRTFFICYFGVGSNSVVQPFFTYTFATIFMVLAFLILTYIHYTKTQLHSALYFENSNSLLFMSHQARTMNKPTPLEQSVVVPLQPYMDEQYLEGLPPGVAGNNEGATSLSHMMHKVSADESLNLDHTENRLRASAVAARKALEDATPGVRNGVAFKYNRCAWRILNARRVIYLLCLGGLPLMMTFAAQSVICVNVPVADDVEDWHGVDAEAVEPLAVLETNYSEACNGSYHRALWVFFICTYVLLGIALPVAGLFIRRRHYSHKVFTPFLLPLMESNQSLPLDAMIYIRKMVYVSLLVFIPSTLGDTIGALRAGIALAVTLLYLYVLVRRPPYPTYTLSTCGVETDVINALEVLSAVCHAASALVLFFTVLVGTGDGNGPVVVLLVLFFVPLVAVVIPFPRTDVLAYTQHVLKETEAAPLAICQKLRRNAFALVESGAYVVGAEQLLAHNIVSMMFGFHRVNSVARDWRWVLSGEVVKRVFRPPADQRYNSRDAKVVMAEVYSATDTSQDASAPTLGETITDPSRRNNPTLGSGSAATMGLGTSGINGSGGRTRGNFSVSFLDQTLAVNSESDSIATEHSMGARGPPIPRPVGGLMRLGSRRGTHPFRDSGSARSRNSSSESVDSERRRAEISEAAQVGALMSPRSSGRRQCGCFGLRRGADSSSESSDGEGGFGGSSGSAVPGGSGSNGLNGSGNSLSGGRRARVEVREVDIDHFSEFDVQYRHKNLIAQNMSTRVIFDLLVANQERDRAIVQQLTSVLVEAQLYKDARYMFLRWTTMSSIFIGCLHALIELAVETGQFDAAQRIQKYLEVQAHREDVETYWVEHAFASAQVANDASNLKEQFLANVSHEIRTPLHGILGHNELLMQSELTERQRTWVRTIANSGHLLRHIVNDVLDLSKITRAELQLELYPFRLLVAFDHIVDLLAARAIAKGIELLAFIEPNCAIHVVGDEARIQRVIMNLCSNAIKFTKTGFVMLHVQLTGLSRTHADISVSVSDTGIGIKRKHVNTLFTRFTQVQNHARGGTGLGLAISKELVSLMGGRLEVKSEYGRGSKFYFSCRLLRSLPDVTSNANNADGDDVPLGDVAPGMLAEESEMCDELAMANNSAGSGVEEAERLPVVVVVVHPSRKVGRTIKRMLRTIVDDAADTRSLVEAQKRLATFANARSAKRAVVMLDVALQDDLDALVAFVDAMRFPAMVAALVPLHSPDLPNVPSIHKPIILSRVRTRLTKMLVGAGAIAAPVGPVLTNSVSQPLDAAAGLRVLIVEDNDVNRLMAMQILEMAGFTNVSGAPDGRVGADMVLSEGYDIVCMDCFMPVMDGFASTRAIRHQLDTRREQAERDGDEAALAAVGNPVIVALTANTTPAGRLECKEAGMDDFLAKPFSSAELTGMVLKWAKGRTARRAPSQPSKLDASIISHMESTSVMNHRRMASNGGWNAMGAVPEIELAALSESLVSINPMLSNRDNPLFATADALGAGVGSSPSPRSPLNSGRSPLSSGRSNGSLKKKGKKGVGSSGRSEDTGSASVSATSSYSSSSTSSSSPLANNTTANGNQSASSVSSSWVASHSSYEWATPSDARLEARLEAADGEEGEAGGDTQGGDTQGDDPQDGAVTVRRNAMVVVTDQMLTGMLAGKLLSDPLIGFEAVDVCKDLASVATAAAGVAMVAIDTACAGFTAADAYAAVRAANADVPVLILRAVGSKAPPFDAAGELAMPLQVPAVAAVIDAARTGR